MKETVLYLEIIRSYMTEELGQLNDMVDRVFLELWKRKLGGHVLAEEYFKDFPIRRFNLDQMGASLSKRNLSERSLGRGLAILSDLKLLFYFLGNVTDYFYVGMARIVGNSKYEDVNLNALSH